MYTLMSTCYVYFDEYFFYVYFDINIYTYCIKVFLSLWTSIIPGYPVETKTIIKLFMGGNVGSDG